jgi:hypothetical protein
VSLLVGRRQSRGLLGPEMVFLNLKKLVAPIVKRFGFVSLVRWGSILLFLD